MSTEIQALKARLEQLETKQKQAEQQRREAEQKLDAKITSDELKNDAAASDRHFLTAEGFTAGYSDNRFIIQSADGNFTWRPWLHFQMRDVVEDRANRLGGKKYPEDEVDNGFEIRRMRFGFDGNLYSPDFTYFFNWTTNRASGNTTVSGATPSATGGTVTASNNLGGVPFLEEAWVAYHLPTTPFSIKLGQQHDPLIHEELTSSRYRHSAEISLTGDIFANGDAFTEGAFLIYDAGKNLRVEAGVNHGMRSANTNFLDYPNNGGYNAFDYGFAGRAEWKFFGRWKDYGQVGAVDTKEPLLVVGTGADYSERGREGQLVAAADAMYADQNGLLFYGEFVDRYTTHNFGAYTQSGVGASIITPDPAVAGKPTNEYSLLAEGGYIINKRIEPFARYEFMHIQGDAAGSHNWLNVVTGGVNYYFHGHRVKLTLQAMWLPQGLPFDDSPSDELSSPNGHREIDFEAQLQILL
ncbi:MAG TPA: hypothetical protein VG326_11700, partial [Tepidisphaeraceae bacterium]|nr:hypothetical protein [Tepidisphaeraceae bacterium]